MLKRSIFLMCLIIIISSLLMVSAANDSWPVFQHDAQHTGRSILTGPEYPEIKWSVPGNSNILSDKNGTMYSYGNQYLSSINRNGVKRDIVNVGNVLYGSALSFDGTLYITAEKALYAYSSTTGLLKWVYKNTRENRSQPIIGQDGTIYFTSFDRNLYAINKDGTLKWKFYTQGGDDYVSPALGADGTIYFGSYNQFFYAISPDGTKKWEFNSKDEFNSSPSIGADGTVYTGCNNGKIYAFSPQGVLKWEYSTGKGFGSTPAIAADGTIYVASKALIALKPDGTKKWEYGSEMCSTPIVDSKGTVFTVTDSGILYAINPDGSLKWQMALDNITAQNGRYSGLTLTTEGHIHLVYQGLLTDIGEGIQAPTLISPSDTAVSVKPSCILTWSKIPNANGYDIEISTSPLFANRIVYNSPYPNKNVILAYNTTYYWRVRAKNKNSLSVWSSIFSFTTEQFVQVTGLDASIRNSKLGSPTYGIGVINNTGLTQTVTVDQEINRQSEFDIMIKNTGNVPDQFVITTSTIIDNALSSKWKVAIYNDSGIDLTSKIFNKGWTSYRVKPGESIKLRLRIASSSKQIIDESNPPKLSVNITAQSMNDITNGAATPISDTIVGVVILTKRSNLY